MPYLLGAGAGFRFAEVLHDAEGVQVVLFGDGCWPSTGRLLREKVAGAFGDIGESLEYPGIEGG